MFIFIRTLWLLLLGAGLTVAHAQAPAPTDPAATAADLPRLLTAISTWPDTSRMNQLRDFNLRLCREGRFTEAALVVTQLQQLAHHLGTPDQLAYAWQSAGQLASRVGPDTAAIVAFRQGYLAACQPRPATLAPRLYYAAQVRLLLNVGLQYSLVDQLAFAQQYTQQGLAIAQQRGLALEMAMAYSNLANIAQHQHHPALVLIYNAAALRGYQRAGRLDKYYAALMLRAQVLAEQKRYESANSLYRHILAYAQRARSTQLLGEVYSAWPPTLWHLHQPAAAERLALRGLTWARQTHDILRYRLDTYAFLTQLKVSQGDYRQALAYQQRGQQLRDSLFTQQKSAQLVEAETRYQSAQKQARITLLAQRNTQQQRLVGGLLAGLTLVGGLLGLVLRQRGQLRRANHQLRTTNQTVSEQAQRLATLLQELHHRVKNNLATVASLLRLQSTRLTDATAQRAVQESRQRVEAMSLIHQRLYQGQEVTQVDMHAYLLDLTDGLLRAYGQAPHAVDLILQVPNPALDVDVAIPLGLLVNELVTNSLKHAVPHVAHPQLRVRLHYSPAEGLTLEVEDNGPGFDPAQVSPTSFGRRLIAVLSEQLGGSWQQGNRPGASYRLHIPAAELPSRP
jgi:two-component sensor histidine kinase